MRARCINADTIVSPVRDLLTLGRIYDIEIIGLSKTTAKLICDNNKEYKLRASRFQIIRNIPNTIQIL